MNIEWERDVIKQLADKLLKEGFRVFISGDKTYGFFTDQEGKRTVRFNLHYLAIRFSGNYITDTPQQTGTGWVITDDVVSDYHQLLYTPAPEWALRGAKIIRYRTLEDHLKMYQSSSKYEEIFKEDVCNLK